MSIGRVVSAAFPSELDAAQSVDWTTRLYRRKAGIKVLEM
ncbi:hypothetical protein CLV80_113120 [Yoonia maritima]|uniref:Uncharacterized protein n=1 Tax=Yoonia maritima TaxID=1435347 RepID=A0A2T0VUU3_9RHOB|nr:hypothetical protein CLV80_113120 [Yoonia maritima]